MKTKEQIQKLITQTQQIIDENSMKLNLLQHELQYSVREKWTPPTGNFIVGNNGNVVDLGNCTDKDLVDPEFGNARSTLLKALKLSKNQKQFNRVSAYFDDIKPVITCEENCHYTKVSIEWYDYSKKDLSIFKEDVLL